MVLLKFLVGLLTCSVIVGACALFLRPVSNGLIVGAVATQLIWLEIEWGFSFPVKDASELAVRLAEEAGTLFSGIALLVYLRIRNMRAV